MRHGNDTEPTENGNEMVLPGPGMPGNTVGKPRKRIGILIVAYNALTTLSKVLKRIPADVWANIEEVAVFDDASKDETYELAVGYKTLFGVDKLTIFRNEKNLGYGGNQKHGYRYFIDKGFDAVVMLHGDGQYAPEMLADLYGPIVDGRADAVFGSRMLPDFGGPLKGGMPLYKYVGNKILTGLANRALGMKLSEFHSGYRAYSLDALRQIDFSRMTNDFHFDTEIIIKLMHQRFRIIEVPIPTYYGDEICYVNGMKYAKDVVRSIIRYHTTTRGIGVSPEYCEYQPYYPLKTSRHSSHDYCRRLCGKSKDILDVGCGHGYFAELLAADGHRVVGIDGLSEPERPAAFQRFLTADLDGGLNQAKSQLDGDRFDLVLLQDVLEHLRRPESMLADCKALLKQGGEVVISVPNVANVTVRIGLLFGRFEYKPRGILDRTHLRFFTRRSARRFLQESGFEIVREKVTIIPFEVVFRLDPEGWLARSMNRTLALLTGLMPGLLGYQLLFVARPIAEPRQERMPGRITKAA
jgi:2-polyprenyl-3-methyl-5-hydroxy-6-metoxy-1,4-benzoquinol methylase